MTLGGLEEGVTPLEMAYAYSTIANTACACHDAGPGPSTGPVASRGSRPRRIERDEQARAAGGVFPSEVGQDREGDARRSWSPAAPARPPQVGDEFIRGKTGTTENYGDAWFVGGNDE